MSAKIFMAVQDSLQPVQRGVNAVAAFDGDDAIAGRFGHGALYSIAGRASRATWVSRADEGVRPTFKNQTGQDTRTRSRCARRFVLSDSRRNRNRGRR